MKNELTSIGEILNENFADEQFGHICKVSTFFSFWKDIVGQKFEKKSKPYKIKFNKLFVSCENSFIVQELNMFKKDIIKKLIPYAKGLDIEIDDISFNYKNWNELKDKSTEKDFDDKKEYDLNDIEAVKIDEEKIKSIKKNISNIPYLNASQKEKYIKDIENNLKINILRNGQN